MARTLSPQLFGPTETDVTGGKVEVQLSQKKWREIEDKIEILSKKIAMCIQASESKQNEKTESLQLQQKALSEQVRNLTDQFSQLQVILQSKLKERRNAEAQSQDLIDRHQQVVQNFESRLNQLQKVTTEQELKIRSYQATYDEILREIRNIMKK